MEIYDHNEYMNHLKKITLNELNKIIHELFDLNKMNIVIVN